MSVQKNESSGALAMILLLLKLSKLENETKTKPFIIFAILRWSVWLVCATAHLRIIAPKQHS